MVGRAVVVVLAAVTLVACSDDGPSESDVVDRGLAVATFEVAGDEQFKIALATPELVDHAERLLAGEEIAAIPNGVVVRDDPGVNEPWSWHIDPATLEFADMTIEVCDGIPSFVESGEVTSERYCPWSAEVVAVEES